MYQVADMGGDEGQPRLTFINSVAAHFASRFDPDQNAGLATA
ncbi:MULTISPECIES: hypothetical protein [Pseudomonas]|jgi:hypothetical protein|nr:hypothetical protein [Pseudomonas putida]